MIDFGFDKLALIGAVALIVIGPEKLPRVARTVGHFVGKAQRYVNEVKAEVNRSIELEELQKMKSEFETAAHTMERSVSDQWQQTTRDLQDTWTSSDPTPSLDAPGTPPAPVYTRPDKHWRLKRGALPQWYRRRQRIRSHALSGAARVARFRPRSGPR